MSFDLASIADAFKAAGIAERKVRMCNEKYSRAVDSLQPQHQVNPIMTLAINPLIMVTHPFPSLTPSSP